MADVETVSEKKVNIQSAVRASQNFLTNMRSSIGELLDVRLEEVELSEDESAWLITLGFIRPSSGILTEQPKREYRRFEIDTLTGDLKSMKIRAV